MTTPTACHITGGAESVIEPVDGHLHHLPQRLIFWAHGLWNEDRVTSPFQLKLSLQECFHLPVQWEGVWIRRCYSLWFVCRWTLRPRPPSRSLFPPWSWRSRLRTCHCEQWALFFKKKTTTFCDGSYLTALDESNKRNINLLQHEFQSFIKHAWVKCFSIALKNWNKYWNICLTEWS